jgi:hypothetical protein
VNTQSTRMIFTYTLLSGITGACVGVLHPQTRSIVLLRVNIITRGWVMIDLKAQLYWARVERWVALGTFALGFNSSKIIHETVRQQNTVNYPYLYTSNPTQSSKTSTEERGEAVLRYESRFKGQTPALTITVFLQF